MVLIDFKILLNVIMRRNSMTIYLICPRLSGRGGIETVLTIVIEQFIKKGFNVVLCIQGQPEYTEWLKKLNIQIIYGKRYSYLFTISKLFIFAKKNSRFIITSTSRTSLIGVFIRKLFRKKWLLYHWLHFSLNMDNDYSYLDKCDGILAISSAIVHQLKYFKIDNEKIHLIYNPCVISQAKRFNVSTEHKRFVYVGRLEDNQKNVSELLKALSLLNDHNVILDVYGDGKDKENYKKLCRRLELDNVVIWHGWKDNIWENIEYRPDALILPSRFEGFPMILLEAMGQGIPCITSDFLGYKDIIVDKRNGTHYQLGHTEELAGILDNFESANFSSEVIKDSVKKFSPQKYILRLEKAIQI